MVEKSLTFFARSKWIRGWVRVLLSVQRSSFVGFRERCMLLRWAGLDVDSTAVVSPEVDFVGVAIKIGKNVFINRGCLIDGDGGVVIEDRVSLGFRVQIITSTHDFGPANRRAGPSRKLSVSIGAGSWIGAGVTILPGASIGSGCVVGAAALVNSTLVPNALFAGVPARKIRAIDA